MILTDKNSIVENCSKGIWGNKTLDALFCENLAKNPDQTALIDAPDRERFCEGEARRLSYKELDQRVQSLANFITSLGLEADDVLVSQLPNVSEQIIVMLAAMRSGIIISPLPLMWRDHEIVPALEMIKPKAIITMGRVSGHNYAEMMREVALKTDSVRFVLSFGDHLPDGVMSVDNIVNDQSYTLEDQAKPEFDANNIATICWTCNSETDSCPVPRSHNQWIAAGMMATLEADLAEMTTPPVILNPYPLTNLIPIGIFLVPWFQTGGCLILHHPFDAEIFQSLIVREKVDYTGLPPTLIDVLSQGDLFQSSSHDMPLKSLITVWPGPIIGKKGHEWGGSVGDHDFKFKSYDLRPLGELAYFMKEREKASSPPARLMRGSWQVPSFSPAGLHLLEVQLKGSPFKNGDAASLLTGEINIKSPMMFDNYLQPPNKDNSLSMTHSEQGFVSTGLRGVYIGSKGDEAQACEIDVIGRSTDVIFHGGLSISARELDQLYAECDQLSDAAAFSFDDPIMGERIMAAVVPQPGETITLDDFIDYLNMRKVAPYKLPDRIIAVNSIPRNEKGIVLRDHVLEDS